MSQESEVNIFKCLDFLRDNAPEMAKAKAERIYMEEYRKSLKAIQMAKAGGDGQRNSAASQECFAYRSDEYIKHIAALAVAVEVEENMRWLMIAAQAKIEVWRTMESSRRYEAKTL